MSHPRTSPALRNHTQIACDFMIRGVLHQGTVMNYSESGLFIKTKSPGAIGSTLSIRILDPIQSQPVTLIGEVARRQLPLNAADQGLATGLGVRILRASTKIDALLSASEPTS